MQLKKLQALLLQYKPFTVHDVASILSVSHYKASIILSRYARQGNVKRIKPGVYLPVVERYLNPEESFSNPWVIVPAIFPDAYIGGWSAASHWGFTEQLFETTCILTTKKIKHSDLKFSRFLYKLFKIKDYQSFGIVTVWQEQSQVSISDPHKTIVDMIANPKCGGGIQQTIDCVKVYLKEFRNDDMLYKYASHMQNGTFFKRLGFLFERLVSPDHPLCALALNKMSKGYIPIDTELKCHKLITKWRLFVPGGFDV